MEYSFNVIHKPWINVRTFDGEVKKVGIRDIFANAHLYDCIEDCDFKYEYGIYNLLEAFLYCTYPMRSLQDKRKLLSQGHFDMPTFDNYIAECEKKRPGCFDLFGENPFYQTFDIEDIKEESDYNRVIKKAIKQAEKQGKKIKIEDIKYVKDEKKIKENKTPVGQLNIRIPTGNNVYVQYSPFAVNKSMSFEEFAKALCSYSLFVYGQEAQYSAKGLTGAGVYPFYFVIRCNNLFNTLVINAITEMTWKTTGNEYLGNAVWEDTTRYPAKASTTRVSLVEGLTFWLRHIKICDVDKNNNILTIYYDSGRNFEVEENEAKGKISTWRSPNALYFIKDGAIQNFIEPPPLEDDKKNKISWTWLKIPFAESLLDSQESDKYSSLVLDELKALSNNSRGICLSEILNSEEEYLNFSTYYIKYKNGKSPAVRQGKYDGYLPCNIVENPLILETFIKLKKDILEVGRCLKSSLNTNLLDIYYSEIDNNKLNEIYIKLSSSTTQKEYTENDVKEVYLQLLSSIVELAKDIYIKYVFNGVKQKGTFKIKNPFNSKDKGINCEYYEGLVLELNNLKKNLYGILKRERGEK